MLVSFFDYIFISLLWEGELAMDSYKKCIVAFLDILGFKNMIHTKAFDEIKNI